MKTNRMAIITVLTLAATAQIARADMARPVRSDVVAAQQTLAWRAQNSKGIQRENLNAEARNLDEMINSLQQGRSVDPREIDRALERAERGSF